MHSDSTSSAPYVANLSSASARIHLLLCVSAACVRHRTLQLDQVLYQLHTVSFFLSPALLPYLSRVLFQFQFAKPRDVDPERSLRFWFFLVVVFNLGSVWSHATENPAQAGNSILLDFVGPGASF